MSAAARPGERARASRSARGAALVAFAAVTTCAAVVLGDANPAVAVAPVLLLTGAWLLWKLPLRWSVAALLAVMLAVDDHAEAAGQWRTPLATLGDLVHFRIDATLPVPLAFSGMELLLVALLAIWLWRASSGIPMDLEHQVPLAPVLRVALVVYAAAVLYALLNGLVQGQPFVPWKLRNLLHPIALVVLFGVAFRPRDREALGAIVVFAACVRAVEAIVVQRLAIADTGGRYATATSHGDSVLFAVAMFLLVAELMERATRRRSVRAAVLLPLIGLGAVENGRRLVWVMLALMLGLAWLVSPMRGWKRAVTRFVLVAVPLAVVYVSVGWDSDARVFAPVRTLRGVTDTSTDHSAYWREVENWNLAMSLRERPLRGLGLGGAYTEHMRNDDISAIYAEYREWPHNTVLGLLLLLGLFAFTAIWSVYAITLFLALRAYRRAADPGDRVAALACAAAVIACHVMAYGDTGAHYPQYKIFAALAMVTASKLAVVTGAWPVRAARRPGGAVPDPLAA